MEFRRINGLPPYVFATINDLKLETRRSGRDVIDLGFGNPDLPSPDVAVEKLAEAAHNPKNHRYSASRGIPKLRQAIANRYQHRFGVEIDPDTEVVTTIGAKEGLSHLMWVLVAPGDTALVPSPSYPIHIYAPLFAGADVRQVRLDGPSGSSGPEGMGPPEPGTAFFDSLMETWESVWPKPRVIVLSFPHNPTTACVDFEFMERIVRFAQEHEVVLVHDFAYADIAFDGYVPPSILQVPGAKEVAVELYTMTKSFSMAGWRVGFLLGNAADRPGADQAEELSRLRDVPADPDRRHRRPQRGARLPEGDQRDLPGPPQRAVRRPAPHRMARGTAQGDDVRLGPDPRALPAHGLARVLQVPGAGGRRGGVARRRVRSGR